MKLFPLSAHVPQPADPANFTGDATLTRMDGVCDGPRVNAYRVTFQPRARTAWHTHSGPQLLLVVEGRCRLQKAGEPVQEVEAGSVVCIEPGDRHWHGASADAPMTHVALNLDASTTWLAKVSDAEYAGATKQSVVKPRVAPRPVRRPADKA